MSTNSMIAMKTEYGYDCIYVHWDGHLDSVGKTLLDTFNTEELALELITLGDCSSIADAKSLDDVVAYHRDKNESWVDVQPMCFLNLSEAVHQYNPEYAYVWKDGKWTAFDDECNEFAWNK